MPAPLGTLAQRGYGYALSLTHDPARADDLLQDAWTRVLQARGPMTQGYLFSAIRSRWIDDHRRAGRVGFEPFDSPVPDASKDPRDLDRAALDRALSTLRPEEREALFLCVVEGYTAVEAGGLMKKPKNTVLSLVHRGRQKLRDWYAAQDRHEVLP